MFYTLHSHTRWHVIMWTMHGHLMWWCEASWGDIETMVTSERVRQTHNCDQSWRHPAIITPIMMLTLIMTPGSDTDISHRMVLTRHSVATQPRPGCQGRIRVTPKHWWLALGEQRIMILKLLNLLTTSSNTIIHGQLWLPSAASKLETHISS